MGFTVGGLTAFPAVGLVTDSTGTAIGTSTSSTPTITVAQKYNDVKSYSKSFTSTRLITECNIVLSWNEDVTKVTSSTSITTIVSPYIGSLKYLIVGAGGSSGGSYTFEGGIYSGYSGGGGRYYKTREITVVNGTLVNFNIGSGVTMSYNGGSNWTTAYTGYKGNSTTISKDSILVDTAERGNPGANGAVSITNNASNSRVRDAKVYPLSGGRIGNGNGGKGGTAYGSFFYDSEDGYSNAYGWARRCADAENGTSGAIVSFGGLSIKTGGGAGGEESYYYDSSKRVYSNAGTSASSDAGLGAVGSNISGSGAAWYYFSH